MKSTTKVLFSAGAICGVIAIAAVVIFQLTHHPDTPAPSTEESLTASEPIAPENLTIASSVVDSVIDLSDPQALAAASTNIALVRIDSLDGANNYSEVAQAYVLPYTYGRMTVVQNFRGELATEQSYEFYRLGGTLPAAQYYAGILSAEQNAKRLELQTARGESDDGKYIQSLAQGDIELQAGKTYLVYLVPESAYYAKPDTYAIIGYQGGLREARQVNDAWQVRNNFTGEWEKLGSVL